jgi:hypothetical protein
MTTVANDGQTLGGFTVGEPDNVSVRHGEPNCRDSSAGWLCTRARGHTGVHIGGTGSRVMAIWESRDE